MPIEIPKGWSIWIAAQAAINEAQHTKESCTFVFNDIEMRATPQSCAPDIVDIYNLKREIQRLNNA
jgi:hypothetical protein